MPNLEDLESITAAANLAKVHPRTIRNWIRAGKLTGYQLPGGGGWRVDLTELRAKVKTVPADKIPA